MNNVNMASMSAMGGPVGAPMPVMNNGAGPQGGPRQYQPNDNHRSLLNTYIYEYFLRYGMLDCARAIASNPEYHVKTKNARLDDNGNPLNGDDAMDTDSKDDLDAKRPEDFPVPIIPMQSDSCFLFEWFSLFWDMFTAQKGTGVSGQVKQYVSYTQQQSRAKQEQQQNMLRQMKPDVQFQMMRNMQNGGMNMNMAMKQANSLPRTAMANSQNNPQAMQMLQQQRQGQMQRDPSEMDGNRARPASPGSTDNAPSPSKKPRLDGAAFPNQGGMMPNGRPAQGMPGQQVGTGPSAAQVQQMLLTNGINPSTLNPDQFQTFSTQSPGVQAKTIATYAANLQQHHGSQMPNKPTMANPAGPQAQGSPMVPQGPDGAALPAFYNAGDLAGAAAMRPGGPGAPVAGGSNHALQDYQMQLMLLEQQNKKRLMMARQEQDVTAGPRDGPAGPAGPGGPGAPQGPNAQPFQGTSPQGRSGASPNPAEQIKRGAQQMSNAGMGSPLPEGAQSRGSPNPINFMGGNPIDPNMAGSPFLKGMNGMDGNMVAAAQMNGAMRPPHPGQPFPGQMTPQQMMAARQAQAQQAAGQNGPQMQWQAGPNGAQMPPQGPQAQVQRTPQQQAMPPPSAPAAANASANARNTTASPQTANAAPPTPQQPNKPAPKKKENKNAKSKAATQKKSNPNLNQGATPAAEPAAEPEPPTPATPITPVNPAFVKAGQMAGAAQAPNGQPGQPAPPANIAGAPLPHADPTQNAGFTMEAGSLDFSTMDFANPLSGTGDVLNDFDFDSFLHDGEDPNGFDFGSTAFTMEGGAGEIGAD